MAKGFARASGGLLLAAGIAALMLGPAGNGLLAGNWYHGALHCLFGITLIGFSLRDDSQASGGLLLVALMCLAWALIGYRIAGSSASDNRAHGVLSMVLAGVASLQMLRRPDSRWRATT